MFRSRLIWRINNRDMVPQLSSNKVSVTFMRILMKTLLVPWFKTDTVTYLRERAMVILALHPKMMNFRRPKASLLYKPPFRSACISIKKI
jgi:hypothetical protein